MFRHLWRPAVAAGVTALALTLVHPASVRVDARATLQVIASGLFNPRGLDFGPDGAQLYVAEAGSGGTGPCIVGSDGLTKCYGATGAVTRSCSTAPRPQRVWSPVCPRLRRRAAPSPPEHTTSTSRALATAT